ncbi:hypothetical protein QL285_091176 [Trifolium repens]|nr:hypothetical protein QL285_091176 [Trifolium repens]
MPFVAESSMMASLRPTTRVKDTRARVSSLQSSQSQPLRSYYHQLFHKQRIKHPHRFSVLFFQQNAVAKTTVFCSSSRILTIIKQHRIFRF